MAGASEPRPPAAPPDGDGLIGLFARHPNGANLLMALMLVCGVFALANLNAQFLPTVEIKRVEVSIAWPGASAEDVDANILEAVEPAVRFLDGVERVRSRAREGAAFTSIEFDHGTDMQKALGDVEQAIAALTTLPEDAETPRIRADRLHDTVLKIGVAGPFSENALQEFARRIRDALLDGGIDQVTFTALRDKEIHVAVPQRELRRLDLELEDVSAAIRQNTVDRPSGTMSGAVERQLRVLAPGETAAAVGGIEVKAFPSGERVLLRDVAAVDAAFDPDAPVGLRRGNPAIELTVWRAKETDALAADRIVRDTLAALEPTLPAALDVGIYGSSTERLWERIGILIRNGWQGLIVVLVVLFVFLDARTAFWVAAGIPIALAATLAVMYASGQTINMISLFALIMMIGVIVDDAIVVGEEADTLTRRGMPPFAAAEAGARRMLAPVMAASITTIASFLPIFLMRDVLGQIMQALPLVVVAIIIASLVECFLVLPGHLAHAARRPRRAGWSPLRQIVVGLLVVAMVIVIARAPLADAPAWMTVPAGLLDGLRQRIGEPGFAAAVAIFAATVAGIVEVLLAWRRGRGAAGSPGAFRRLFDRGFAAFRDGPFRRAVWAAYRFRYATVAFAIGSFIVVVYGLYYGGGHVKFVFFPTPEAESLTTYIRLHAGTPRQRTIEVVRAVETALRAAERDLAPDGEPLVRDAYAIIGQAGEGRADERAQVHVQLTPSEDRSVRTPAISQAWRDRIPEIADVRGISVRQPRAGPPGRDLDIELKDAPPAVLKQAAAELMAALEGYAGVSGVDDDLPWGKPELAMRLTPRGAALGFTLASVGRQIRNAFEGSIARRLAVGDDEIKVRVVQSPSADGSDLPLDELWLKTPAGEFAPLTEVVDITERNSFSLIRRRDGKATVSVTAEVDQDVTTSVEVVEALERELMPAIAARHGLEYSFGGRDEERRRSFADLRQGALLALAAIYVTVAFVFGCYWRPLAVMLIIPFGVVGAVLGHYLLGYSLTIVGFAGLLGLVGILVNDSIILVKRMDERLAGGEALAEAAVAASGDRLRAVLLTSLTTIGGLTPLLFETSLQAEFLKPMAITIVFGLAAATALVLFLVPALVGIGADLEGLAAALFGRRRVAVPAGGGDRARPAE